MGLSAAAALSLAGAGKGVLDARANSKKQDQLDAFRRASIKYSPWSGMSDPGMQSAGNTSMLSGALGGGLQGYSLGKMGTQAGLWGGGAAKPIASSGLGSEYMPQDNQMNQLNQSLGLDSGKMMQASAGAMGNPPGVGQGMQDLYGQGKQLNPFSMKGVWGGMNG